MPACSIDEILDLLGEDRDAAEVPALTGLDHGLQCAAVLLDQRPGDLQLAVAGLVHDVGHRLAPGAPSRHGVVGADWLRPVLGRRVAALVELHVDAKRYLVATEPGYRERLSPGSAATLVLQGEAFDASGAASFESRPFAADALLLRRADEAAKVPGRGVPGLGSWRPALEQVARRVREFSGCTRDVHRETLEW